MKTVKIVFTTECFVEMDVEDGVKTTSDLSEEEKEEVVERLFSQGDFSALKWRMKEGRLKKFDLKSEYR